MSELQPLPSLRAIAAAQFFLSLQPNLADLTYINDRIRKATAVAKHFKGMNLVPFPGTNGCLVPVDRVEREPLDVTEQTTTYHVVPAIGGDMKHLVVTERQIDVRGKDIPVGEACVMRRVSVQYGVKSGTFCYAGSDGDYECRGEFYNVWHENFRDTLLDITRDLGLWGASEPISGELKTQMVVVADEQAELDKEFPEDSGAKWGHRVTGGKEDAALSELLNCLLSSDTLEYQAYLGDEVRTSATLRTCVLGELSWAWEGEGGSEY